ncbi:hypothetical protein [Streptomyces sp. NPDC001020]
MVLVTFTSAAAPAPFLTLVNLTFFVTSRGRPHRSASRITGTSPAWRSARAFSKDVRLAPLSPASGSEFSR